jgi:hypothetical protein
LGRVCHSLSHHIGACIVLIELVLDRIQSIAAKLRAEAAPGELSRSLERLFPVTTMSRRDKRRAETLQFSPLPLAGTSSMQTQIASISASHSQSPEPRRSKRRKIDAKPEFYATASTSTSDIVSTGSRTHQMLSKKRIRKARLAAETKVNIFKTEDDETEQSEPSERLHSMLSAPLTPDSEVQEMENMSAVDDVIEDEDLALMDKVAALEEQLREKDKVFPIHSSYSSLKRAR